VVRVLIGMVAGAVALWAVLGRKGELSGAAAALGQVRIPWLVLAAAAEVSSIAAYAAVQQRMLRAGGVRVPFRSVTLIAFAAYAIQNSLPAGPAWSAMFAFREFRRRGADSVVATWTIVAVSVLSGACLAGIALIGAVLARGEASSLGLVWLLLVIAVGAGAIVFAVHRCACSSRWRAPVIRAVRAVHRIIRRPKGDLGESVEVTLDRLGAVSPRPRDWLAATFFAAGNWGFDCACLVLAFVALDTAIPWRGLLLAYGGGQLAANLPITPGGLGVVEGSLTIGLVYYGGRDATTVAAVLLYRIMSFWALLPLGWAGWLALRVRAQKMDQAT
jgi:uncharacterized protein (TIRG00374 family)